MTFRSYFLALGVLIQGATAFAVAPVKISGKNWQAALERKKIENGRASLLSWRGEGVKDPNAIRIDFLGQKLTPFKHPKTGDTLWAFAPVSYVQKPSTAKIAFTGTADKDLTSELPVEIIAGKYLRERIKVSKSKVELSNADRQRTMREAAEMDAIYASVPRERIWEKEFVLPVKSKVTSPFGTQRVFNDVMQSFHSGLDLRAWTGTSIRSTNAGIVVLAKELFYAGNCVVVDHGSGVYTSYSHLSAFSVKPGDRVEQNQIIGKAGATGRVSAPHLHWGAKIAGVNVDPQVLIDLSRRVVRNNTAL